VRKLREHFAAVDAAVQRSCVGGSSATLPGLPPLDSSSSLGPSQGLGQLAPLGSLTGGGQGGELQSILGSILGSK
jgi:hypothetical protein